MCVTIDRADCAVRAQMGASGRHLRSVLRRLMLMPETQKSLFQECFGKATVLWERLVNVSLVEEALAKGTETLALAR